MSQLYLVHAEAQDLQTISTALSRVAAEIEHEYPDSTEFVDGREQASGSVWAPRQGVERS